MSLPPFTANQGGAPAPASQQQPNAPASQGQQQGQGQAPNLTEAQAIELEKYGTVLVDGKEWTTKELKESLMRQADYTRKTQEIAREKREMQAELKRAQEHKRYYDALATDLRAVKANPELAEEFLRVYPEEFHGYLEDLGVKMPQGKAALPPDVRQKLAKVDELENRFHAQEVAKAEAQLESVCNRMEQKYPYADPDAVMARAQVLCDQNIELTDEIWDKLYKASQSRFEEREKQLRKSRLEKQRDANKRAIESGKGGGTPSKGPVKETMKQATERAVRELAGR